MKELGKRIPRLSMECRSFATRLCQASASRVRPTWFMVHTVAAPFAENYRTGFRLRPKTYPRSSDTMNSQ
jgi:hypothetical protein